MSSFGEKDREHFRLQLAEAQSSLSRCQSEEGREMYIIIIRLLETLLAGEPKTKPVMRHHP